MNKTGQKRIVLGHIFLLVFVTLTIFTAGISHWLWKDTRHHAYEELSYTASVIKSYYELSFNQWELSLRAVGTRLTAITGDDAQMKRFEFVQSALKIHDQLLAFGLADTTGQIIVFTAAQPGDSLPHLVKSENSRRSFLQAKKGDQIVIGEVYYFPNVKDWIIPIRLPIRDEAGKLLAVNTSAIDYNRLTSDLSKFGLESKFHVHLINTTFNTSQLYYPLGTERFYEVLGKEASQYSDLVQLTTIGGTEFFEATNSLDGERVVGAKVELPEIDHQLIVTTRLADLWGVYAKNLTIILVTYVILSLLILFFYWFFKRKQMQYFQELELERANLKAIFESTNNIIGLFDTNKQLIHFNRAFANYAETLEGVILQPGMTSADFKNREFAETFKAFYARALKGEKFKETVKYATPHGDLFFAFTFNAISKKKNITGVSMFVEDVTELKDSQERLQEYNQKLEQMVKERTMELEKKNEDLEIALDNLQGTQRQLIQSEKLASLGALSAGLGHEINNPLNFIANGVKVLVKELEKKYPGSRTEVKPFIDIIDQGVERATGIVKSLSHFNRQGDELTDDCEIHDILENCLVILHAKWRNRITIDRQYSKNTIIIKGSEGKLHQAFLNILSNAIQAIPDEGTITVTTGQKGKKAIISIQDTGSGMSDELLARIRDPFFTTRAPGEGVGLGLFITQAIIEEHKGKMDVYSHPGEGTEVLITV